MKRQLWQLFILDLPAILYSDGAKTASFGPLGLIRRSLVAQMSLVLPKSGHQTKTALGPEHHHRSSRHQISPPRSVHTFQVLLPGKTHEKSMHRKLEKNRSVHIFLMILLPGKTQEKVCTGNLEISRKHVFTRSLPASFGGEGGGQGVLDGWSVGVG